MYRTDPKATSELYALSISTSKGGNLVGLLLGVSILFAVAYLVTIFAGAPPGVEGFTWTMPVGAILFAVPAYLVQRKRRRKLSIIKRGEGLRLLVADAGVELEFPLECRGTQFTTRLNNLPIHEVFLQLVDRNRRAITLHTTRGAAHGPQDDWALPAIDRETVRSDAFDAPASSLAEVRRMVERFSDTAG
jgi:hypothetical protein